jgi:hypothetical protein
MDMRAIAVHLSRNSGARRHDEGVEHDVDFKDMRTTAVHPTPKSETRRHDALDGHDGLHLGM